MIVYSDGIVKWYPSTVTPVIQLLNISQLGGKLSTFIAQIHWLWPKHASVHSSTSPSLSVSSYQVMAFAVTVPWASKNPKNTGESNGTKITSWMIDNCMSGPSGPSGPSLPSGPSVPSGPSSREIAIQSWLTNKLVADPGNTPWSDTR